MVAGLVGTVGMFYPNQVSAPGGRVVSSNAEMGRLQMLIGAFHLSIGLGMKIIKETSECS